VVSQLIEALCYKLEGGRFVSQFDYLISLIYLILPAAIWPEVDSASNRNDHQESSWGKILPERKTDVTAICELIV
jgi:hypothetical protein